MTKVSTRIKAISDISIDTRLGKPSYHITQYYPPLKLSERKKLNELSLAENDVKLGKSLYYEIHPIKYLIIIRSLLLETNHDLYLLFLNEEDLS